MNHPMALPTKTSLAKWSRAATLAALTALASPYATTAVSRDGYSCASTLAADHVSMAWPEGNEELKGELDFQKRPWPPPSVGRSRCVNNFRLSTTMRLLVIASRVRIPASR